MHGQQARGAGGIHNVCGAAQIEQVADSAGEDALPHTGQMLVRKLDHTPVIRGVRGVPADEGRNPSPGDLILRVAGVLEGPPHLL